MSAVVGVVMALDVTVQWAVEMWPWTGQFWGQGFFRLLALRVTELHQNAAICISFNKRLSTLKELLSAIAVARG